ncbi:MAG: aminotransferase [Myxococcota bacterium]
MVRSALAEKDIAHTLHPYTALHQHAERGPHIITRGEGIYVWDEAGHRFIEGLSGLWCTGLGYSEPRLIEAASRQLHALPFGHSFVHRACAPTIELAEKLIGLAPDGLDRAFFVNSGSEANDTAVKFVWYYNNALGRREKKKIIAHRRAYHGVTVASASLSGLSKMHQEFDLPLDRFLHVSPPHFYSEGRPGETEAAFVERLASELDQRIQDEGAETVAAFIGEPVMGAGGAILPPRAYYPAIQQVLKKHEVLMIADEVVTGLGRTGQMWGSQTFGIEPDVLITAKQLSSAYLPIGAVLISDTMYRAFVENSAKLGQFGTGHTYGGHPVAAAVALEVLNIYEDRDLLSHIRRMAEPFAVRMRELGEHPLVGEARSVGLIGAVELIDERTDAPFDAHHRAAHLVNDITTKNGLFLRALTNEIVAVCPPVIVTEEEIHLIFDTLKRALDEALQQLRS